VVLSLTCTTEHRMPEEFWVTDKGPTTTSILEWRFLSSEALEFETYRLIIGCGSRVTTQEGLDLIVEVFSDGFGAGFGEEVVCSDMYWFDLSLIT
jgi:hypothetical protein